MNEQCRKTQPQLPWASKFSLWTSENGSLVVRRASEISLNSLVSDNFQSKTVSKLKTAR